MRNLGDLFSNTRRKPVWWRSLCAFMKTSTLFWIVLIYGVVALPLLVFVDTCACCWVCKLFGINEKIELTKGLGWLGAGIIAVYLARVNAERAEAHHETAKASHKSADENILSGSRERLRGGRRDFEGEQGWKRVGGAHEMFLASLEGRMEGHRWAVATVVCLHIRDETSKPSYQKANPISPSFEMRSLLQLMFMGGNEEQRKNVEDFWKGMRVDLSGSYLVGCDLEGANFKEARLDGVCFNSANLKGARFYGASLVESKFVCAELTDAAFMGATLTNARFWEATLSHARFQGSLLDGANFMRARLYDTEFMGAEMPQAHFEGAVSNHEGGLQRWHFRGAFHSAALSMKNPPNDFKSRLDEGLTSWQRYSPLSDGTDRRYEPILEGICFRGVLEEKTIDLVAGEIAKFRTKPYPGQAEGERSSLTSLEGGSFRSLGRSEV